MDMISSYSQQTETVLEAIMCPALNSDQVTRLFDIIPGLDTCHYDHNTGLSVCLSVSVWRSFNTDQVPRLFDIIPGLDTVVRTLDSQHSVMGSNPSQDTAKFF